MASDDVPVLEDLNGPPPPPPARRTNTGTCALFVAIAAFGLTSAMGNMKKKDLPADPVARRGAQAADLTCTLFPAVLAVGALGLGVAARRAPSERGVATLAILIAVAYLGLLGVGVGFAVWTNRRKPRAPAAPTGPPITEAEARAFAKDLEASLARGDPTLFDRRFDQEALIDRAFAGLDLSDAARDGALRGFQRNTGSLGRQVAQSIQADGGSYTLLRVRRDGDRPTLLFRMLGEAGVNYHELTLRRGADGSLMFDDLNVFVGGIRMSALLRRLGTPEGERQMLAAGRMAELVRGGDHRGALRFHDGLPPAERASKELLVLRFAASQALGPEEMERTVELIDRACPDDPGTQLILIDSLMAHGEFARSVRILEALDAVVDGDPFLVAMQANVLLGSGDIAAARERGRAAAASEPGLRLPVVVLLGAALHDRDHASTLELLRRLEADFGEDRGDVAKDPDFAMFAGTSEYDAWMATRPAAPRGRSDRAPDPPR